MHSKFPFSILTAALLCFGLPAGAQAQTTPPQPTCTIDLSSAIAALADAQVSATQGDQAAALALVADVQAQLDAVETACAFPGPEVDLVQVFTAPDDLFGFHYPLNWFAGAFEPGLDWNDMLIGLSVDEPLPQGGQVALSSQALEDDTDSISASPEEGVRVLVSVGSPLHILHSVGLYQEEAAVEFVNAGFTLETLGNALLLPLNEEHTDNPITKIDIEAPRPTIAIDMRDTEFPIYVVLVALDADQDLYGLVVGVAEDARRYELSYWTLAIAETLDTTP